MSTGRGGPRPRAGRPGEGKEVKLTIRIDQAEAELLDAYAQERDLFHGTRPCRSKAVRALIKGLRR